MGTLNSSIAALRRDFREKGWIVVPGAIPVDLVQQLARWVEIDNRDLSSPVGQTPPVWDELPEEAHRISDVVQQVIQELFHFTAEFVDGRISVFERNASAWHVHVDGQGMVQRRQMGWHQLPYFQLLTGVYCTEINRAGRASLTVVDGGPHRVAKFFNECGRRHFRPSGTVEELDSAALWRELSDFLRTLNADAHRLVTKPGDLIIAHGLMPHGVEANEGFETRRGLYSRHGIPLVRGLEALVSPYAGWPNF